MARNCRRLLRRFVVILASLTAVTTASVLGLPAAQAAAPSCTAVGAGFNTVLTPGHCLVSPNKKYKLIMQRDGNLVLYRASGGAACWASSWSGGGYRAGDEALFSVVTIGIKGLAADYEYGLAVGHRAWSGLFWATYRYDVIFTTRIGHTNLNVNVNDNGQFWIGYKKIGAC